MKIDEEAEKLRAQELVKQFKLEMGMTGTSTDVGGGGGQNLGQQNKDQLL